MGQGVTRIERGRRRLHDESPGRDFRQRKEMTRGARMSAKEGGEDTVSGASPGGPWAVFLPGPKGCPSASFYFSNSFLFSYSFFFCEICKKAPKRF
jgi:hypothetical protein